MKSGKQFDIGFSPCPNDTFMFYAMMHNRIDCHGYSFNPSLLDIDVLNQNAYNSTYDISKMSFYTWLKLKSEYLLLDAGSALGFQCGPMLVSKKSKIDLENAVIAIPGEDTTANLLLSLWADCPVKKEVVRFDQIMPGVCDGSFDAGIIIHEGRFVYQSLGLEMVVDLGQWWEDETGSPIPLGCIGLRNTPELLQHKANIEAMIRQSIEYAKDFPPEMRTYIKNYAQEMDDTVIESHIKLYVNDFSLSLGDKGERAIVELEKRASAKGLI